jgi:hypothetical protein
VAWELMRRRPCVAPAVVQGYGRATLRPGLPQIGAGLDVPNTDRNVGVVTRDRPGQRPAAVRSLRTRTPDVLARRAWLQAPGWAVSAMERTGGDWQPLCNRLAGHCTGLLGQPAHRKPVPRRQTAVQDCRGLAARLAQGLLRGSCLPPVAIRALRALTRSRRQLVHAHRAAVQRLQQVREEAKSPGARVATAGMGVSGRAIRPALRAGVGSPEAFAALAHGRLRQKTPALQAALPGRCRPPHTPLLTPRLAPMELLDARMAAGEAPLAALGRPCAAGSALWDPIPGGRQRPAQALRAEPGVERAWLPSAKPLCSWAKGSPGNTASAGKRKRGRTGTGTQWLRAVLVACAHAAGHPHETSLGTTWRRFASRQGQQRAAVMVAPRLVEAADCMSCAKVPSRELGEQERATHHRQHLSRHHRRRLESVGLHIDIRTLPLTG